MPVGFLTEREKRAGIGATALAGQKDVLGKGEGQCKRKHQSLRSVFGKGDGIGTGQGGDVHTQGNNGNHNGDIRNPGNGHHTGGGHGGGKINNEGKHKEGRRPRHLLTGSGHSGEGRGLAASALLLTLIHRST